MTASEQVIEVIRSKKRLDYSQIDPYIRGDANGVASFAPGILAGFFGQGPGFAS